MQAPKVMLDAAVPEIISLRLRYVVVYGRLDSTGATVVWSSGNGELHTVAEPYGLLQRQRGKAHEAFPPRLGYQNPFLIKQNSLHHFLAF